MSTTVVQAPPFTLPFAFNNQLPDDGGPTDPPDPPEDTFEGIFVASSPQDGSTLATSTFFFVVGLVPEDPSDTSNYTIEIQYAADTTFTSPTTLSETVNAIAGGVVIPPTISAPATTSWRARLLDANGTQIQGWTDPLTFTIVTTVTATVLPVTWTVDTSAERPIHLWHIDPPGPEVGDTVTVYGQGFPSTGHLSFGDALLDVDSWQLVAPITATDDPAKIDGPDRVIDGDTISPEHYEVVFVAPPYDGPGAPLTVEV